MNKLIFVAAVLAVLQIAQSEILTLLVILVVSFIFVKRLLKEAAERN